MPVPKELTGTGIRRVIPISVLLIFTTQFFL